MIIESNKKYESLSNDLEFHKKLDNFLIDIVKNQDNGSGSSYPLNQKIYLFLENALREKRMRNLDKLLGEKDI